MCESTLELRNPPGANPAPISLGGNPVIGRGPDFISSLHNRAIIIFFLLSINYETCYIILTGETEMNHVN